MLILEPFHESYVIIHFRGRSHIAGVGTTNLPNTLLNDIIPFWLVFLAGESLEGPVSIGPKLLLGLVQNLLHETGQHCMHKYKRMEKTDIQHLHEQLLTCWNHQDAIGLASLFCENDNTIGFDVSQLDGKSAIREGLEKVFTSHQTASYVWKVDEIRVLSSAIALLRARVGMVPPGKKEINPSTNAIQSLVAVVENQTWKIALFQNTPAQFHGRPELVESMTKELVN